VKVAVFGGSFDPVHNGHLNVVSELLSLEKFDKILVLPSKNSFFGKKLHPFSARLEMARIAFSNFDSRVEVSDFEGRNGIESTFELAAALEKAHPEWEFVFVIGSDAVLDLGKWKDNERLLENTKFLVISRKGFPAVELPSHNFEFVRAKVELEISSTDIRNRIKNFEKFSHLVPVDVEDYVNDKGLYGIN